MPYWAKGKERREKFFFKEPFGTVIQNDNLDSLRNLLELNFGTAIGLSEAGNLSKQPFRIIQFSKDQIT
ncbi:hypothetical protein RCL_jg6257.t1 [Rhizophagus clarus]|uniref:Uncharacterized protein n=1 Tax=Rhizophagus clarus TaxID=94130 RepID=A0A8H3L5G2_9GLOM|nr:hypothetical protein RCL_jg6257.t1 [Rhizophagus clarus]